MRRQLTRSGLRRYLYTAAAILLLFLMYRWLTRRPEYSSMYGYRGEVSTSMTIFRQLIRQFFFSSRNRNILEKVAAGGSTVS
ncbi:hypothetical protein Aduo_006104 [Ancylostoma duodenale]